jgi:SPP1 gp7 family putative phage head morphogenesis protein
MSKKSKKSKKKSKVPYADEIYPNVEQRFRNLEDIILRIMRRAFDNVLSQIQQIGLFQKDLTQYETLINTLLILYDGTIDRKGIIALYGSYLIIVYQQGMYSTIDEIPEGVISFGAPDIAFLEFMYNQAPAIFNNYFGEVGEKLRKTLLEGLATGGGWQAAQKRIEKVFRYSADRANKIVRTELARATIEGRLSQYKKSTQVKKVQRCAEPRGPCSLTPTCQELHGKIYDKHEASGVLPAHVRCECCWRPITEFMIREGLVET